MTGVAVVCGVSEGLGEAICRAFARRGFKVVPISRTEKPVAALGSGVVTYACDITCPAEVERTVAKIHDEVGPIDVLVHNAGAFSYAPFLEANLEDFDRAWAVSARSAFVLAQRILPGMLARGRGTLLFSGATASLRGSPKFAALASSKFALRGLAQSLAREFGPLGIHVAHVVIDGVIWCDWTRERFQVDRDRCVDPDALAETFVSLHQQPSSVWTFELDVRPAGERF